jgi:hypothetical protein
MIVRPESRFFAVTVLCGAEYTEALCVCGGGFHRAPVKVENDPKSRKISGCFVFNQVRIFSQQSHEQATLATRLWEICLNF